MAPPELTTPHVPATRTASKRLVAGWPVLVAAAVSLRRRLNGAAVPSEAVVWRIPVAVVAPDAPKAAVDLEPAVPVMDPGASLPEALDGTAFAVLAAPSTSHPDKPAMIDDVQDLVVERVRSTKAQQIGDEGERLAALRLEALGWRILGRNVRLARVEVDLLAVDPAWPPALVIIEVRRRNRRDFGLAEETVDHRKWAALHRAAAELEARHALDDGTLLPSLPVRIDLIAMDRGPDGRPAIRHHRGVGG